VGLQLGDSLIDAPSFVLGKVETMYDVNQDLGGFWVSAASVFRGCCTAQFGGALLRSLRHNAQRPAYNPGMALIALIKKLFRALSRVIPRCGMASQAVAFNMFLAFFAVLLTALSLMKNSLKGEGGQDLAVRISAILPPGSWQLMSAYMLRQEVNAWYLALIGWVGTLLVGSQVMKLIIKGIELIYGDHGTLSFLGRQLRGLLLFSVTIVVWLVAVALSVFGRPIRHWITPRFDASPLIRSLWYVSLPVLGMVLAILVLALIYRLARPGTTTWRSALPGAAVATILWWGVNLLFGIYVRKMNYGLVFGGLAAAIGLMAWMELSAMIVFLGAAWNAESATGHGISPLPQNHPRMT
jgi:membrane protein